MCTNNQNPCNYPNLGWGYTRLMDRQMEAVKGGLPVYLRLRNFAPVNTTLAGQLGFAITPARDGGGTGTTDIIVQPTPAVRFLSMHNIGMSGGKLLFGARTFTISHSFVQQQVLLLGAPFDTTQRFWTNDDVVGLVTEGFLFSIEDIKHEELGGVTVVWTITANNSSLK